MVLNPLYVFQEMEEREGRIIGQLARRGNLLHIDKLSMAGIALEHEMAGEQEAKGE
ncbi:hypothetical protein D3C77_686790 [compost metagenome]